MTFQSYALPVDYKHILY